MICLKHGCDGALSTLPIDRDPKTGEPFIRCPKCGARNGLIFSVKGPPGQYRLGRLLKD